MEVRTAREDDLPGLVGLMVDYCRFYRSDPGAEALEALARALLADPEREGVQLVAVTRAASPVGFATVFWTWSTTAAQRLAVMNDLYVVPSSRGQGIAEVLIDGCRELARAHGARRLGWQTAPDNYRAQAVYDRVGAQREQWVDYWLAVVGETAGR
ncbi:MAG: GNAT family N-acetyltransferase [Solirubrobacteraceae bacterium]